MSLLFRGDRGGPGGNGCDAAFEELAVFVAEGALVLERRVQVGGFPLSRVVDE